jgi:hypothetical protein
LFTNDVFLGRFKIYMGEEKTNEEKRKARVKDLSIQMLDDVLYEQPLK